MENNDIKSKILSTLDKDGEVDFYEDNFHIKVYQESFQNKIGWHFIATYTDGRILPAKLWGHKENQHLLNIIKKYFAVTVYLQQKNVDQFGAELTFVSDSVSKIEPKFNPSSQIRLKLDKEKLERFILENQISQSAIEIVLTKIQNGEKDNEENANRIE